MTTIRSFLIIFILFVFAAPGFADTTALLEQAIEYYKTDNHEASRSKLAEILKAEPENQMALYYMGIVHYKQGNAKLAIPYLEKVAQSANPIEGVESFLADIYLFVGEAGKALVWFEKEYKVKPEDENIAYNYAASLKGVGREDEAAKIFRRLIEGGGAQADAARYELGSMLSQRGAYVSATKQFSAIKPGSPYSEAAGSYMESLAPFTKLFNLYGSAEYFYDDNPDSTSATRLGLGDLPTATGSHGKILLAMVNTRNFELTDRMMAKMGYTYYAISYNNELAKSNDFIGHYLSPSLSYRTRSSIDLTLKGNAQFYDLDDQKYSTNLGAKLTAKWPLKDRQSVNVNVAYMDKSYESSFVSSGVARSLKYRDADTYSVGFGTVYTTRWDDTLTLDYTLNDERTINEGDPVLGSKASDSRFREHAVRADLVVPFKGRLSRLSIMGNANYSNKDYLNTQTGELYPSVTGRQFDVKLLTLELKAQISLSKAAGLNLAVGMEQSDSRSIATEQVYERNRYFIQLSASY